MLDTCWISQTLDIIHEILHTLLITIVNHATSEPPCDDVLHNNVALGQSNDQVNYALIFAETMHEEAFIRVIQII